MSRKTKGAIIAGSIIAVILAVYIGGMLYLEGKFFANTTVNGIDVAYSTASKIEKGIAATASKYQIELQGRNGINEVILGTSIDYSYVFKGEVQGFLEEQRLYLWPLSFFKDTEFYFENSIEYNREKLAEQARMLRYFDKEFYDEPENAEMVFNGIRYEIKEEKQGNKPIGKAVGQALSEAVNRGDVFLDLDEEQYYEAPEITTEDKKLQTLVENMNAYANIEVVYRFDKGVQEVLDGSIIHKWLHVDENGTVSLDEEKVAFYVDYLADHYDTSGKTREFQTNDGSWVSVNGGSYGWLIDREAETQELTELLHTSKARAKNHTKNQTMRQPVYAREAVSRANSDMGEDYIEIDLTKQYLWMYIGGEVVLETNIVSGTYNVSRKKTPPGTFTLYYKQSPAILRGDYPGDSYETPVRYWMPFNNGIGLHDATWRGRFGGEIYMNSGSHGCINMPYSVAAEMYDLIYSGIPIICFYR